MTYVPSSPEPAVVHVLFFDFLSRRSGIWTRFFVGILFFPLATEVSAENVVYIGVNVRFEKDLKNGWWRSRSSASCCIHSLRSRVGKGPQRGTWQIVSTNLFTYYSIWWYNLIIQHEPASTPAATHLLISMSIYIHSLFTKRLSAHIENIISHLGSINSVLKFEPYLYLQTECYFAVLSRMWQYMMELSCGSVLSGWDSSCPCSLLCY